MYSTGKQPDGMVAKNTSKKKPKITKQGCANICFVVRLQGLHEILHGHCLEVQVQQRLTNAA